MTPRELLKSLQALDEKSLDAYFMVGSLEDGWNEIKSVSVTQPEGNVILHLSEGDDTPEATLRLQKDTSPFFIK